MQITALFCDARVALPQSFLLALEFRFVAEPSQVTVFTLTSFDFISSIFFLPFQHHHGTADENRNGTMYIQCCAASEVDPEYFGKNIFYSALVCFTDDPILSFLTRTP